ncbi:MAG TPA: DUF4349 domain-containing protein [Solirubrobacteraceae bacterium]|nr:DUF4349 domain-containing protein [Solirubrobacteraceae bacterium]
MPDLTPQMERELAELEAALAPIIRDERPEPRDAWAARMDRLMEAEFKAAAAPRPSRGRRWWQLLLSAPALGSVAAAVLVVAVVFSYQGTIGTDDEAPTTMQAERGGSSSESAGGSGEGATTADSAAPASGGGAARSAAEEAAGVSPDAPQSSTAEPLPIVPPGPGEGTPGVDGRERRKVERSAAITLAARPRSIDPVARQVSDLADAQGGFVVSSSVASSRNGGGGTITLRVPEPNLDATMAELARLAAVRDRSQRMEDITARSVSARERLQDARAERRALLRQLEEATTLQAAAAIRARLRDVAAEISTAEAAVRRVNNRAAFATVTVTLVADAGAGPAGEEDDGVWSPGDAADDALRVLEVIAGVALIALAVLIPLALIVLPVWLAARWGARRGRERALDAA